MGYPIPDGKTDHIELQDNLSILVMGRPGTGKTSLLRHTIDQEERCGVIDIEEHLSCRHDVLFDPERSIQPFNLLATKRPYETAESIVETFSKAWGQSFMDRAADITRHAVLLLIEHGLNLTHLPGLLSDDRYRTGLAEESQNDGVRSFFLDHVGAISRPEWHRWIESVRNKTAQFVDSPYVRPFLETKECVDFHELMTKRVLFNFPERLMHSSASLLGMLVVSKVYATALERPVESPPWRLYADEFQRLASRAFLDLTSRGRKRGVSTCVSFQSLSQLDPAYGDELLQTVGTKVVFAVGRKDAECMAKEVLPPSGTVIKRAKKKHWLYGGQDVQSFYSVQEEIEQMATEIEYQKQGECFVRTAGRAYCATTFEAPPTSPLEPPKCSLDERKPPKAAPEPPKAKAPKQGRRKPPEEYTGDPLD
jgi:hypothetical protein